MQLRARRAAAQLLHRPALEGAGPAGAVRHLLAVQAQELRSARLALRARRAALTAADVDEALGGERSLVVSWLCRGTLHLVGREDYPWLVGLTAPTRMTANRRRLWQEGVSEADAERAVGVIAEALAAEGPLTRTELAERMRARGIRTEGQATPHLLMLTALGGLAVLGPLRKDVPAFALTRDWLGIDPPAPLEGAARDGALAELARRYLAAHGPASAADLAAWAGVPLRDARRGLAAIAATLVEEHGGLVDLGGRPAAPPVPPRLLPAFDPYLLGWKDRSFAVPAEHARKVHPGGGVVRATATAGGLVVGTWSPARLAMEPFEELEAGVAAALHEELEDVRRFATP